MKDGRYAVVYRETGKKNPTYEYFGRGPAGKQQAEERDLEVKLLKKRNKLVPRNEAVYLDTLSQAYLKDAAIRGASQKFREEFSKLLNEKILPSLCYKPVNDLTYPEVLEVASVCWGHLSLSSRQRYIGYLRAVFRFGTRHKMTQNNPLEGWKRQREPRKRVDLTVEDFQKIMDVAPKHLAWALEVEWELGTRPGVTELFGVRWDDVDFDAGIVHVRGSKTEGSDRLIPVTAQFLERLRERRKSARSEFLIEYAGRPIKTIRQGLKTAVQKAGLSYNVRPYDIRHLFATVMLTGGGDLAAVSKLLGHASVHTTSTVYYHLLKDEKARATRLRPVVRQAPKNPTNKPTNASSEEATEKGLVGQNVGREEKEPL